MCNTCIQKKILLAKFNNAYNGFNITNHFKILKAKFSLN